MHKNKIQFEEFVTKQLREKGVFYLRNFQNIPTIQVTPAVDLLNYVIQLYQYTKEIAYLNCASKIGDQLIEKYQTLPPPHLIDQPPIKEALSSLLNLYAITLNKKYLIHFYIFDILENDTSNLKYSKQELNAIKFNLIAIKLHLYRLTENDNLLYKINLDISNFYQDCVFRKHNIIPYSTLMKDKEFYQKHVTFLSIKNTFIELSSFFNNPSFLHTAQLLPDKTVQKATDYEKLLYIRFTLLNEIRKNKDFLSSRPQVVVNEVLPQLIDQSLREIKSIKIKSICSINDYIKVIMFFYASQFSKEETYKLQSRKYMLRLLKKHNYKMTIDLPNELYTILFLMIEPDRSKPVKSSLNYSTKLAFKSFPAINISIPEQKRQILYNTFPKTLTLLLNACSAATIAYINNNKSKEEKTDENKSFKTYVKHIQNSNKSLSGSLSSTYNLELQKSYIIKNSYSEGQIVDAKETDLFHLVAQKLTFPLKLTNQVKIVDVEINTVLKVFDATFNAIIHDQPNQSIALIYNPQKQQCDEIMIDQLNCFILNTFKKSGYIENAQIKILAQMDLEPQEFQSVKDLIHNRILRLIQINLLSPVILNTTP